MTADDVFKNFGFYIGAFRRGGICLIWTRNLILQRGYLLLRPMSWVRFIIQALGVWTNKPASGAMRGHGAVNTDVQ
ncbi:MAG: hypothetical protein CM15mP8_1270 [Methanobacteriota archaeon]|nr:MAG: hypothetical protein CM15mP8_1270 [Euryarchaeota archaeon]